MSLSLRYYQKEAIVACLNEINQGKNALVSIFCGLGKSLIIAGLIKVLKANKSSIRCLMLVNNATLVNQNFNKISNILPDTKCAVYCAGLKVKELNADVIYASVQSLFRVDANNIGFIDTIIIDEVQAVSDAGTGMFWGLINKIKKINPGVKIVGLTATPFRLSCGLITEAKEKIFEDICYEYGVEQGINDKFLCPLISKVSEEQLDLTNVRIKGKEYDESDLDFLLSNEEKVDRSVKEALLRSADRKHRLWFCVSIHHTEMVAEKLKELGFNCAYITGDTSIKEREHIFQEFEKGIITDIVNCDTLTTGTDIPCIDCLIMLRPTKSVGLFIQIIGRGVRLHESKSDCLILDFANLIATHGAINDIKIKRNYNKVTKKNELEAVKVLDNTKICPDCRSVIKRDLIECPHCGYQYTRTEVLSHDIKPTELSIMSFGDKSKMKDVTSMSSVKWISKTGNVSLKVIFKCDKEDIPIFYFNNSKEIKNLFNMALIREQLVADYIKKTFNCSDINELIRIYDNDYIRLIEDCCDHHLLNMPKQIKVERNEYGYYKLLGYEW